MTKVMFSFGRRMDPAPCPQRNSPAVPNLSRPDFWRGLTALLFAGFVLGGGITRTSAQTVPLPRIPNNIFNITSPPYNAIGDGITTNTTAIQSAITACNAAGGGTILVPSGIYLCGPITLGNSNNLLLAAGALLRMLPMGSYPANAPAFITASSLKDVEISGSGAIDGQGPPWLAAFNNNANLARPVMLNITKCTRAAVLGISLTNAPIMHITAKNNTSFTMQGVTIFTSFPTKNTDGIDLAANGAYVNGDSISDGDDVIALGSSGSFTGNVFVTNCAFGNGHGLSMGSNTGGGISNINVINCTFTGTQYGLKGKSARDRGGLAQFVNYANITLTNIQFPISFSSYYPDNPTDPSLDTGSPITSTTPFWNNTTFSNITATAATGFAVGSLWGLPEAPISNMVMQAVTLNGKTGLQVFHVRSLEFDGNSAINVTQGPRFFTFDAQLSSQFQLAAAQNSIGITSDGAAFSGGLDGNGNAYSATALGPSQSPGGFLFKFGAPGSMNTISATGQTLNFPAGLQANYQELTFLGAAVNGPQTSQPFVVHYTDGSAQAFVQNLSDWGASQGNVGESIVATMDHRNAANGSTKSLTTYLYQYNFIVQSNKFVSSVTLPINPNVVILGAPLLSILPSNTVPTLLSLTNVTITARPSSAILSWTASAGTTSVLRYGTTPACTLTYQLSTPTAPNQSALIPGLVTNSTYYFQIIAGSGNDGAVTNGTFSTDVEVVLQSSQATYAGVWINDSTAADKFSPTYKFASVAPAAPVASATFRPNIPVAGLYDVYLWYSEGGNRSTIAPVVVTSQNGVFSTTVNETQPGGQWQLITTQPFNAGTNAYVQLGNSTGENNKIVIADAVRWVYSPTQDLPANGNTPGWWTSFYFGNLVLSGSVPGANGYNLLQNYILGLSPVDPNAVLSINLHRSGTNVQAVFSPWDSGRQYQLQSALNLRNPLWLNVPNATLQITNGQGTFTDPNPGPAPKFYRLSVLMTP